MTKPKKSLTESASELITDGRGKRSGKRIITIAAFGLLAIAFIANLFWGLHIDKDILHDMFYIVLFGVGAITAEPIAQKLGESVTPAPQQPTATPPPNPPPQT